MIIFLTAIGVYLAIHLFSTMFVSKIISKTKHKTELQEQIIFHQINVYNNFYWIPLSLIMLTLPLFIIVWLIVCSQIYSYTIKKGQVISAVCNWKKVHINKNCHFEHKSRIVEIQYHISEKKIKLKTKVPEIVYNQIHEGPFEILASEKYPKFWVLSQSRYSYLNPYKK